MKVATWRGESRFTIDEVSDPVAGPGQVVVAVQAAPVDLTICKCDGGACATLKAGKVKVTTRCIDADHDKACGNETTLYQPLARGVSAKAAMATEHTFTGKGLNETWSDRDRRGAFVGEFRTR